MCRESRAAQKLKLKLKLHHLKARPDFKDADSWFQKLETGIQTARFQGSVFVVRMSEGYM